jgi:ABC-2 type transport system ATP-binding protein
LLAALIAGGAGIEALSIERPSLHEAFVELVGERVPQLHLGEVTA